MEHKKTNVPHNTISRDMVRMSEQTGNVYETVMVIAKRANQISQELKKELQGKLEEFATITDDLQEVFENQEQTEVSRHYERMPKATLIAAKEYEDEELYFNIASRAKK